jgi:hypothetical protein
MGSIGSCCCCCGTVTLPTTFAITGIGTHGVEGWAASGSSGCCYRSQIDLDDEPWEYICSDPTYTDTRSAEGFYDIYSKLGPVTTITDPGDDSGLVCSVTKGGTVVCTVNGESLPGCTSDDSLCDTVHEVVSQYTAQVLGVRWRCIGYRTYYYRVATACDGGEESCKWVVVSQMLIEAQSGYLQLGTYSADITQTGSDCCGTHAETTDTEVTCEDAGPGLSSNTLLEFAITRAKVFDTQPTGAITFAAGDTIDCDAELDCITVAGTYDTLVYNSIDTGWSLAWTAPSCAGPTTDTQICYSFAIFDYTGNETCIAAEYPFTRSIYYATGSLLTNWDGLDTWGCTRSCRTLTGGATFYDLPTGAVTRVICRDITSSRTTTGYTARSITLNFPSWELVFTP